MVILGYHSNCNFYMKVFQIEGAGHATLGNFSIDQVVIEFTEITQ